MSVRQIVKLVKATRQREGAGFIVAQPIPHRQLRDGDYDPFLLVHALGPVMVDYRSPGAPWHPHRGFDTVTYILQGENQHQDSMGNQGVIKAGEVQWMRAASGIIHDEGNKMTRSDPPRPHEGFQIWVNLPSSLKMSPPDYRQLTAETFKFVEYTDHGSTGSQIKLIAGHLEGSSSITSPLTDALAIPVLLADIRIAPGGRTVISLDRSYETAFAFVFHGKARVYNGDLDTSGTVVERDDGVLYKEEAGSIVIAAMDDAEYPPLPASALAQPPTSESLEVAARAHRGASVLLLGGRKIRESVARHGPFVMNTAEQLAEAFSDYEAGKLATVKASETRY